MTDLAPALTALHAGEAAFLAAGAPSKFPTLPVLLRPVVRALVFRRILRRKAFVTMKASEPFIPAVGLATPAEGHARVESALTRFDRACRAREASGQDVVSSIFGKVSVADFARFQELHVRHHLLQMPGAT